MSNVKVVKNELTEEEKKKITEVDWAGYYKDNANHDSNQLMSCPSCQAVIVLKGGESEITCWRCKETVSCA